MTALDRGQARAVLRGRLPQDARWDAWVEGTLDALDGCVESGPARTVDRHALGAAWDDGNAVGLDGWVGPNRGTEPDVEAVRCREQYLDKHALVRPVESVILTPEDIRQAVQPVLWNASNYPRPAQPHILGQDITPLVTRVVDALTARLGDVS